MQIVVYVLFFLIVGVNCFEKGKGIVGFPYWPSKFNFLLC